MSEAPDKPEDQPSSQPQSDKEEHPQRREVPEDELKEILEVHETWVQSEGKEGKLANLEGANLEGATLIRAKDLTQKQLDEACGDTETKLPPGLSIEQCPEESE